MKQQFSQEQIIKILHEGESGLAVDDLIRKYGIGRSTYHKWKAKFGGMSVNDAMRLKALEQENNKLKRLVADLSLEAIALKDVLSKKW
ncbi:MAG TPA: transposase [Chondromyces sp.]|nr:transposase [Chondromyces sp.]